MLSSSGAGGMELVHPTSEVAAGVDRGADTEHPQEATGPQAEAEAAAGEAAAEISSALAGKVIFDGFP